MVAGSIPAGPTGTPQVSWVCGCGGTRQHGGIPDESLKFFPLSLPLAGDERNAPERPHSGHMAVLVTEVAHGGHAAAGAT